jgi:rSAM/selenodomain-associated transferase 1
VDKAATTAVIVFARAPVAGASKTRLIPALGEKAAASLHARMIEHTLETLADVPADHDLQLWCAPNTTHPLFARLADRYDLSLHIQRGNNLGARMYHALDTALLVHDHAIVIGTDCPGLVSADILAATDALKTTADAVIGPAADGGYWLLGVQAVSATLFSEIAWGSDRVYEQTLQRIETLGWRSHALRTQTDIDRPEDLARLPVRLLKGLT